MKKLDKNKLILAVAAPLLAIVAALVITSVIIAATGKDPLHAYQVMVDFGSKSDSQVWIINKATPYYLSALAVAIGFRMNLFNIGVDGQYRIAAFFAAVVGGSLTLPGFVQIPLVILVAMVVGAIWAGIAGLLKTTRGVSEVISTIMLNSIGASVIGYFLQDGRLAIKEGNLIHTPYLPDSAHFFEIPTTPKPVYGFVIVAALAGLVYWFVLSRTRFGFDLRTVGRSESAAQAGGVSVKRMVVTSMVLSGAVAGLVGMPTLLGVSYNYGTDF
ncbi:sugar ABC transporter permease, partial [Streptomyces varsoviensis]